jgi:hypothetical protein
MLSLEEAAAVEAMALLSVRFVSERQVGGEKRPHEWGKRGLALKVVGAQTNQLMIVALVK